MRRQSLGGTIPIMRDDGHLLTQGKQFVYMRGLCLFELFERTVVLTLYALRTCGYLFAPTLLHIEDGSESLSSFLGCAELMHGVHQLALKRLQARHESRQMGCLGRCPRLRPGCCLR